MHYSLLKITHKPLLTLCLFLLGLAANLNAQATKILTPPIQITEPVYLQTNAYGKKWRRLLENQQRQAAASMRDSMLLAVLGKTVTTAYLTEMSGAVRNTGVTTTPYVLHTFFLACDNCAAEAEAINHAAKAFADQVTTFVLLPAPDTSDRIDLDWFNDEVTILFDHHFRDPFSYPEDSRLLGLIGYPVSFYLTPAHRIVGVDMSFHRFATIDHRQKKKIHKAHKRHPAKRLFRAYAHLAKFQNE